MPEGTTDIDILEAGWNYVDANKVVVYGAIDPIDTVLEKNAGVQEPDQGGRPVRLCSSFCQASAGQF